MTKVNLTDIESAAKSLALSREKLSAIVGALNDTIERAKRETLPLIKRQVAQCAARSSELSHLIDEGRELFVKPRTVHFHGIKCGLEKGKGTIDIDDPERTIALIEKHFTEEQQDLLIDTKKTVNKKALKGLTVADLKKVGCNVEETGDVIVIRFTDSATDKLVKALLKDAIDEATEQAA
jgi:hypothetical protein